MLNWLKRMLLGFDRTEAASERAAKAMEDIADSLESARDGLRQRLGMEPPREASLEASEPVRNSRRKASV
jgi:hypothetical protein